MREKKLIPEDHRGQSKNEGTHVISLHDFLIGIWERKRGGGKGLEKPGESRGGGVGTWRRGEHEIRGPIIVSGELECTQEREKKVLGRWGRTKGARELQSSQLMKYQGYSKEGLRWGQLINDNKGKSHGHGGVSEERKKRFIFKDEF